MHLMIERVLDETALSELVDLLQRVEFADGAATAGWAARPVKQNEQAAPDPSLDAWSERIVCQLTAHPVFAIAARPKRVIGPLFSRYRSGAAYGTHVDEAMLDGNRSDLSFTLFLSDPASYNGGELVVETAAGDDSFKGEAGSLLLYPATTLHRVEQVTRGTRYAAVGWVRSLIRRDDQREILFDLETARQGVFASQGKTGEFDLLSKCVANLLRQWCDD